MADVVVSRRGLTGRRRLVAVVVALGLSAVACQSTDGGETSAGVADVPEETRASPDGGADTVTDGDTDTADGGSGDDGDAGAEPTEADFEEAQLAFEQCMADAGIETDLGGGDGEVLSAEIQASGDGRVDDADFQKIMDDCNEVFEGIVGSFEPSPEQEAEMRDAEAAFANCMADKGFEFETDGGVMVFETDSDDDFEAMDEATQECSVETFGEDGPILEEGN